MPCGTHLDNFFGVVGKQFVKHGTGALRTGREAETEGGRRKREGGNKREGGRDSVSSCRDTGNRCKQEDVHYAAMAFVRGIVLTILRSSGWSAHTFPIDLDAHFPPVHWPFPPGSS
jgi:hypothetical protein